MRLVRHAFRNFDRSGRHVACPAASPAQAEAAIDLDHLTATQAAADLCAGKYTSAALVSAALARAKARAELNAFITLDEAGAMKAARAYDAAHARHAPLRAARRRADRDQGQYRGGRAAGQRPGRRR